MRRVRQGALAPGETEPSAVDRSAPPDISGRNLLTALLALLVLGAALVPAMALGRGTVHVGPLLVEPDETVGRTLLVVAGDAVVAGRSAPRPGCCSRSRRSRSCRGWSS